MRTRWIVLALAAGCGPGLCVGTGGIVDECKEGWSKDECAEWDDIGVNDADWTYFGSGTCDGKGYSVECSDGSWVLPSDADVCG